jgi:hypothetical protein
MFGFQFAMHFTARHSHEEVLMAPTPQFPVNLAVSWCRTCHGSGWRPTDAAEVCPCVYRVIFRTCYAQFRRCRQDARSTQPIPLERRSTPQGLRHSTWVRRNEDYCADFQVAARQALGPALFRLFRLHYLLRIPASLIGKQFHVHPSVVRKLLLRVQCAVGRQIAECSPYSIYPPALYLGASLRSPR